MTKVLCAALWYDDGKTYPHVPKNIATGIVMCGYRHHNIFPMLHFAAISGNTEMTIMSEKVRQGFLTDDGLYVDRKEAALIAYKAGQLTELKDQLYSEDLY